MGVLVVVVTLSLVLDNISVDVSELPGKEFPPFKPICNPKNKTNIYIMFPPMQIKIKMLHLVS